MAEYDPVAQKQKKTPKVWDINNHEFVYAPPKPDGDPWNVLLKPLMEKDKVQCDAWKEEVQNLLIFAGLFSAVVTAFTVESYKALQPNPNDAIIGLLSHIATRLDNPLNGTGAGSSSTIHLPPFLPTSSSIRVNTFWFLSLILSLTTVLVGIVTLQWLREYQSYPGLSPKESLAVFRMRARGMEKWYVWKIFTALPLLLQAALVLFFGGVIDFLLALESSVAIPIAVVVGFTLLFLVVTTALPTFQGLFLYFPFLFTRDLSKEPEQCPYKSPQSHAFRVLLSFSFRLFHNTFPLFRSLVSYLRSQLHFFVQYFTMLFKSKTENDDLDLDSVNFDLENMDENSDPVVVPQLLSTWQTKNWRDFDSAWLLLRDACVHCMKDKQLGLALQRKRCNAVPLFDTVQVINEALGDAHTDTLRLSAIYHAFSGLSSSIVGLDGDRNDIVARDITHRRNRYFHSLWDQESGLTLYEHQYEFIQYHRSLDLQDSVELHFQNLNLFISGSRRSDGTGVSAILSRHISELQILLAGCWGKPRERVQYSNLPRHLKLPWWNKHSKMIYWQYSQVLKAFFVSAAGKNSVTLPGSLHGHRGVLEFLKDAAQMTSVALYRPDLTNDTMDEDAIDVPEAYRTIFAYIGEQLNQSLKSIPVNNSDDTPRPEMSYLFYTSAVYAKFFTSDYTCPSLCKVLEAFFSSMRRYKQRTGGVNRFIEGQLQDDDRGGYLDPFTESWWAFLNCHYHPFLTVSESHPQESWLLDSENQPNLTTLEILNYETKQNIETPIANDAVLSME